MATAGLFFAAAQPNGGGSGANGTNSRIVDIIADGGHSIPYGDTTAMVLVGNFAAHHNGAVITSDSAIRYNDRRFEFFGNVLINKGSTYIYGDRAEYNGDRNEARVFSPLVKTMDGDATLYTYDFSFNTLRNIGSFTRTGTLVNRDSRMESQRGYYYADRHEMIAVGDVQMKNDTYELTGDSVIYNTQTDKAHFFDNTHIWNVDGDYLYGDAGRYEKQGEMYALTRNGYILTPKQEMWSDSLNYFKDTEHVRMWDNIQLDDTEQMLLAFGDYGEYWDTPGDAILTRRPVVISYDPEQGADSLYMRADTMQMFTLPTEGWGVPPETEVNVSEGADSLATEQMPIDSLGMDMPADSVDEPVDDVARAAGQGPDELPIGENQDSLQSVIHRDSLSEARARPVEDPGITEDIEQLIEDLSEVPEGTVVDPVIARQEALAATQEVSKEAKTAAKAAAKEAKQEAKRQKREAKRAARLARIEARERRYDELMGIRTDTLKVDSLALDSLSRDSLSRDTLALDSLEAEPQLDSIYRIVKGYRNVKAFRTEYQLVCDSLVSDSRDSMVRMYYDPVLWNEENQIAADEIRLFTANQEPVKAEFEGHPVMIAELDTLNYNQVSGKLITAWFRDSEIYRNDVDGNVQTIYYMQEDGNPVPTEMISIESGNASYYIEDQTVTGIVYRNQVTSSVFPMDKIPEGQDRFLEDFRWEAARRPVLNDVFDRSIRPSERAWRVMLPKPLFPISERIDTYRKSIIDSGFWADREDKLTPEVIDWIRSLKN